MKLEHFNSNAKRVVDDSGSIIGFALQLANGRWAPFDKKDRRLVVADISFKNPNAVLKFFKMAADGLNGGAS